jgi:hypothetical protein
MRSLRERRADLAPLALAVFALAVYLLSNPLRSNLYNHFVWQADAYLHGRFAIEWPVSTGAFVNDYFQDVMPLSSTPGYGLIPYPPLPAVLILPLVALFGLATDAASVAALVGAGNVGVAWLISRKLTSTNAQALLATAFYGFGTVAWYAAMLGSTWFLAHVVASAFLLLAINVALGGELATGDTRGRERRDRAFERRQFVAGILFAMAALARLTTILGGPFFAFVGRGRFAARAVSAAAGAVIPLALLVTYNLVSTGSPFHPAYDYAYRTEYTPRAELRHDDWAPEDIRYIPQNLVIMLAWLPTLRPQCDSALLDPACAPLQPDPLGMSLLLSSPGYLLAAGVVLRRRRTADSTADDPVTAAGNRNAPAGDRTAAADDPDSAAGQRHALRALDRGLERRLIVGATLAVVAIAVADLAHFSQGWVQFGYRFSNDFAPFALVLVALGVARIGVRPLSIALVALSVLVNAWGVYWGVVLRW